MKLIVAAVICLATFNVVQCLSRGKERSQSNFYGSKINIPKQRDYVFNFNDNAIVDSWYEYSDVQRDGVGESKADFVLLESNITRTAVFFGVANSLTYDKGAATVRTEGFWDWSNYTKILFNIRGDAPDGEYYFVLNHKGINNGARNTRYRLQFEVPEQPTTIELPLSSFAPPVTEGAEPLDTSRITSIGIAFDTTAAGQFIVAGFEVNYIAVA